MHDAYLSHLLLKLPLQVESLASAGDQLFVGTRDGHLLMYGVTPRPGGGEHAVQLLRSNKYFSKKAILQLAVVPEYSILVALKEGMVSVHDIDMAVTNFPTISQVTETRGTTLFALDVLRTPSLTGETAVAVRMAVVMRRKLQFYYWKNRKFHKLQEDLTVGDVPRSLAWAGDSLCLGTRGEYSILHMAAQAQEAMELFPTGKSQEPRVTLLQDGRFALDKDEQTTFIDSKGKLNPKAVKWSEVPLATVHDQPYLISVLSKSIEIRTDEPSVLIQTVELPKPRLVTRAGQGRIYVAAQGLVWLFTMVPVAEQVPQLLRDKQFELAVTVANICDKSLDDKSRRIQHIETLMAFDLFCNYKFSESMAVFLRLDIDPSHVIGLYSSLLPPDFQERLSYPDSPPQLQGREQENGLLSLIEYLTQVRHKLNSCQTPMELAPLPMVEGVETIRKRSTLLQVIDTTLLKCYLQTNDALVASLLRLKDNNCHLVEAERVLRKAGKFTELVILYNTRGLHRKALELLASHSAREDSQLRGVERTVTYLQNLGPSHIELVLEFSQWVLLASPEEGLAIFTEDMDTVESLPRAQVLDFLLRNGRALVIPYLEHLVLVWGEEGATFHNSLLLQYKDRVLESDLRDEESRAKLGRLLSREPVCYSAAQVLAQFPPDRLFPERAALLGRAGRPREALAIYVHVLGDLEAARSYCAGSGSWQHLVELLVRPPAQEHLAALGLSPAQVRPPDLDSAVSILESHGGEVELAPVLASLPPATPLHRLAAFLTSSLEARVSARHSTALLRALRHSEHLLLQEERVAVEGARVDLTEATVCAACGRRFQTLTAFYRRPDGSLVHYACGQH